MGSSPSVLTLEAVVASATAAGVIGIGYKRVGQTSSNAPTTIRAPPSSGKKGNKKQKQDNAWLDQAPETPPVPPIANIVRGRREPDKSSPPSANEDNEPSPLPKAAQGLEEK